jgi:hypothetical protein
MTCKRDITDVLFSSHYFLLLPLAFTMALRPAMYNGIRQLPVRVAAIGVLGGLAGWMIERARRVRCHA